MKKALETIEALADQSSLIVAAHRGYKSAYPENTLLAFQKALELGVDMLEFDLRLSKDNVLMVLHDETLDRTTNGTGPIGDYSLTELKQLDAGGWFNQVFEGLKIPTFEELCQLLQPYSEVLLNVEIKKSENAQEAVDKTIALLQQYGYLSRCVFTCFDADILAYLHDKHQVRTQGFLGDVMSNFVPGDTGTYSKMWAAGISMSLLTPEVVASFQDMGILAWCYCPDDEQQAAYALECGVTLMTCNDPVPALRMRPTIIA
ncbi:glycerophosphodiester phosphodiesterase family protein [Paenibacillus agricola]|uniref:Glycerophosphodiester phosphodiesterase n=1 Tax=Paenibacillus agricola TaxID=2716264 RepID=A0ABX0J2L8_9BACL|nr:glycerophosphodiester phosphodiesterase family protein [Paenibacillus agricola]NHN29053.1 glycerophosphodiester phosphodiesterase [Paenibacillus agricola]